MIAAVCCRACGAYPAVKDGMCLGCWVDLLDRAAEARDEVMAADECVAGET